VQGVPVVQFKNVNFTYPTAKHNSLSNINLDFELGKSYAVIGGTGSSKSTLLNVIMRFYDVTSGEVLVNGENVSKITQQDLRKQLSFTPQKTILTNGSIKDNITFALDEQDAIDEDRFNKVLHCSCVDEFLTNFEEGANKEISQSETGLSGGQRQRVAIARCIYKDASIYIFDDSFSALDYKTQSMVKTRLDEFLSDKCAIYSTERASIAMLCDEIIMLNKGRILALGNHKDLYDSCPEYKDFVLSQVDESEAV
ncbi:MAG: ABC transporter ATP-binding protein/permease, partial [Coriobacteriales bacterium]|nr:ABC transporter ATP-binding protein/permease [Coriobacteriales bacterium]